MGRLATSWEIAKRSWSVLRSDKSLAWFPVLSFLGSVVVVAVVGGLIALAGIDDSPNGESLAPFGWVLVVIAYIGLAIVQTYFLAGLVAGADERLRGGKSTVGGALQVANSRLHRLLPWALVSATVSIILSVLERYGIVGRIVAGLVGLGVEPRDVPHHPDPGDRGRRRRPCVRGARRSCSRRPGARTSSGRPGSECSGSSRCCPRSSLIAVGTQLGTAGLILFGGIGVVCLVVASTVLAALNGIYRTALYRFATTGEVPPDFAGTDFQGAFRPKREPGNGNGFGFGPG